MQSGHHRRSWVGAVLLVCMAAATASGAAPDNVRELLKTMAGPNTVDNPRITETSEGYIKFLGAPAGNTFTPSSTAKSAGAADAVARAFLREHGKAFGISDSRVSFTTERVKTLYARTYVRLQQTFNGVPVFGAQALVQMRPDGGIVSILSDIMRDAPRVYSGALSMTPNLTPNAARAAGLNVLSGENPGVTFDASEPQLYLYMPYVLGTTGLARLVYVVDVHSADTFVPIGDTLLIDAHSGATVLRIPLVINAKFRMIFDAESTPFVDLGTLARAEGDPATGIADVDNAYDFYGDTYDFYFAEHSRDSIDNFGLIMEATVRYCGAGCPFENAFWDGSLQRMYFGDGFVTDDVVGHELTHGVTQHESNLIYFMESGAINESFSDIWGEFIDLTNGKGNDSNAVRWLMGEEIPGGALRNMQNPPASPGFPCPDTYQGPFWIYDPLFDYGGVHINSGVGNKVAYLLTDGDTFQGFTVNPLGMSNVADLFYECQTNLLTQSSDYHDLGDQLLQAADNLGFSSGEIEEIFNALLATKIKEFEGKPLRHFRATGRSGDNRVALTWKNPTAGDFTGVDIVRRTSRPPNNVGDGTLLISITNGAERYIDNSPGAAGSDVYYGIFPRAGSLPINEPLFARATIGVDVDYLTESFSDGTDLAYTQVTFVPTGPLPGGSIGFDQLPVYFNYTTYTAHVSTDAKIAPAFDGTLPVEKEDYFEIALPDDGSFTFFPEMPIPFFGRFMTSLAISSNGYIAAVADEYETDFSPTLENHFDAPRISFLFSDLDPRSGGEVWGRLLDDRVVITFEDVPSFDHPGIGGGLPGATFTNTVQCELFYGGQIRFTYLDLTVQRAVVGLSDGNGVPLDVDDVLAGLADPGVRLTNLRGLPDSPALELQPIPLHFIQSGDVVQFTALAESSVGTPTYSSVNLPSDLGAFIMTGATLDPVTGEFVWDSTGFPDGIYGAVLCASAGGHTSCQIIGVVVSTTLDPPQARNVSLSPANPTDSQNLIADYNYFHPTLPEGPTVLFWFKNNAMIPAFTNQLLLPAGATKAGDHWYFRVLPTTVQVGNFFEEDVYLRGPIVQSATVIIQPDMKLDANRDGRVNAVDLQLVVTGLLGTAPPDVNPDVNGDGREDAADVQSTVNYILSKRN